MENRILEWVAPYLKMLMCCHRQKGDLELPHPNLPCRGNQSEDKWIEAVLFQHPTYTGSIIIPWFALLNIPNGHELIWQRYWDKYQSEETTDSITHGKWAHDCHTVYDVHPSLHIYTVWERLNTQRHRMCLLLEQREALGSKHCRSFLWESWELLALKLPRIEFLHFPSF